MKSEELRDRKKFLVMQEAIVTERLSNYIDASKHAIHSAVAASNSLDLRVESFTPINAETEESAAELSSALNLEEYLIFRCQSFEEYSTDFINSFLHNLIMSSTKIDKEVFSKLFKVKYVFSALRNRKSAEDCRINVLVNINSGEIAFNIGNERVENITKEFYELIKQNHPSFSKPANSLNKAENSTQNNMRNMSEKCEIYKNKDSKHLYKPKIRNLNVANQQTDKTANMSIYKHKFPSLEFLNLNFYTRKYPNLENLFRMPFSMYVSISEMKKSIFICKTETILLKVSEIKAMTEIDLLYLSSVEYYRLYGYSELISLREAEDCIPFIINQDYSDNTVKTRLDESRIIENTLINGYEDCQLIKNELVDSCEKIESKNEDSHLNLHLESKQLNNPISEALGKFIADVDDTKKLPLLNFLFNIAPGLILFFNFKPYKKLPHSEIVQWVFKYKS